MLSNNAGIELLNKLNERSTEVCEHYCYKLRPFIFNYILRRVNDLSLAEDLTQECLIAFYESIEQFKDESHIERYLLRIASNKCVDYFRSMKKKHAALTVDVADEEPSLPGSHEENEIFFQKAIKLFNELPPAKRELLQALVLEEQTAVEYGKLKNITPDVVRSQKRKILELLRFRLGLK